MGCRLTYCVESDTDYLALRIDPASGPAARGPVRRARRVDAVDKGIIEALQANGREPFRRIAATLGVSESRVSQIHGEAIRALRKALGEEG